MVETLMIESLLYSILTKRNLTSKFYVYLLPNYEQNKILSWSHIYLFIPFYFKFNKTINSDKENFFHFCQK